MHRAESFREKMIGATTKQSCFYFNQANNKQCMVMLVAST